MKDLDTLGNLSSAHPSLAPISKAVASAQIANALHTDINATGRPGHETMKTGASLLGSYAVSEYSSAICAAVGGAAAGPVGAAVGASICAVGGAFLGSEIGASFFQEGQRIHLDQNEVFDSMNKGIMFGLDFRP